MRHAPALQQTSELVSVSTRQAPAPTSADGAPAGLPIFLKTAPGHAGVGGGTSRDDIGDSSTGLPGHPLRIGRVGDPFEQTADAVAALAVRQACDESAVEPSLGALLGRGPSARGTDEAGHTDRKAQRDVPLSTALRPSSAPVLTPPGPGAPLDAKVRQRVEPILGVDLADVRVHDGPAARQTAAHLHARAFTHSHHIWVGPGEQANDLPLMAHEATHVAQQNRMGRSTLVQRAVTFDATASSITIEALRDATDQELNDQVMLLREHIRTLAQDSPELEAAAANMRLLESEVARRTRAARTPPVIFGMDTGTRRIYVSVTVPGHTLAEIATYVYGSPDRAADLQSTNGVADMVPPGRNLRLPEGRLSDTAFGEVESARDSGTLLRTEGVPQGARGDGLVLVYRFSAAGRSYELTDNQLRGMLQGLGVWLYRKADYLHGLAEGGYEVHRDHLRETNSVVRGISDWLADQEELPVSVWDGAIDKSRRVRAALQGANFNAGDLNGGLRLVPQQARDLAAAAGDLDEAKAEWHRYIEGTISGAGIAVHRLEVTRNVSFGIAAGLAGAIAAPAMFVAAGGGALGGGLALGAGTAAGAGTGAALEFTGAVGGQALSMAVTPGQQQFDWGYVEQRTEAGAESGAIQGGIGAAGALVAPGLSNVVSNRLFGTGTAGLTSSGARLTVNAVTGSAIGLPSGAAGAALENAGAYRRGEITGDQYAASIGWGGAFGFGAGAAFSVVPIQGLYRTGGQTGNPFSGRPVTPRWMLGGFGSPVSRNAFQGNWNPPPGFEALTLGELPPLREGYTWMEVGGRYEPTAVNGPMTDPVTVRMYGPDAQGRFNYNFYQQGRLIGSRAFTRPTGGTFQGVPGAQRSNYPMQGADYVDPTTGQAYVRGHNIDFADTAQPPGTPANQLSTMDPLNFTPEEADWGMHVRRLLVGQIRGTSGAQGQYRQIEFYDPASPPRFTVNGRRIPDGVYFAEYSTATGQPVRAFLVRYSQSAGFRTRASANNFAISVNQLPEVLATTPLLTVSGGGVSAGTQSTQREGM